MFGWPHEKRYSGIKTLFGARETYLESLLKALGRKIIFYVFILIFTSEVSLVISLLDWFTLGALAADKNCFDNALLSRFSKSTERPKEKKISLESSFKAPDS